MVVAFINWGDVTNDSKVGAWLHQQVLATGCNSKTFAELAVQTFKRFELTRCITVGDNLNATPLENRLPEQIDFGSLFGEPPITRCWNRHFYIEAYHWFNGTTCIHDYCCAGHCTEYILHAWRITDAIEVGRLNFSLYP